MVSHSAEEFLGQADHVLLLAGGAAAFSGDARDLVDDPARFAAAGLAAPPILRVQQLSRDAGHDPGPFSLDPDAVAAALAACGGWH